MLHIAAGICDLQSRLHERNYESGHETVQGECHRDQNIPFESNKDATHSIPDSSEGKEKSEHVIDIEVEAILRDFDGIISSSGKTICCMSDCSATPNLVIMASLPGSLEGSQNSEEEMETTQPEDIAVAGAMTDNSSGQNNTKLPVVFQVSNKSHSDSIMTDSGISEQTSTESDYSDSLEQDEESVQQIDDFESKEILGNITDNSVNEETPNQPVAPHSTSPNDLSWYDFNSSDFFIDFTLNHDDVPFFEFDPFDPKCELRILGSESSPENNPLNSYDPGNNDVYNTCERISKFSSHISPTKLENGQRGKITTSSQDKQDSDQNVNKLTYFSSPWYEDLNMRVRREDPESGGQSDAKVIDYEFVMHDETWGYSSHERFFDVITGQRILSTIYEFEVSSEEDTESVMTEPIRDLGDPSSESTYLTSEDFMKKDSTKSPSPGRYFGAMNNELTKEENSKSTSLGQKYAAGICDMNNEDSSITSYKLTKENNTELSSPENDIGDMKEMENILDEDLTGGSTKSITPERSNLADYGESNYFAAGKLTMEDETVSMIADRSYMVDCNELEIAKDNFVIATDNYTITETRLITEVNQGNSSEMEREWNEDVFDRGSSDNICLTDSLVITSDASAADSNTTFTVPDVSATNEAVYAMMKSSIAEKKDITSTGDCGLINPTDTANEIKTPGDIAIVETSNEPIVSSSEMCKSGNNSEEISVTKISSTQEQSFAEASNLVCNSQSLVTSTPNCTDKNIPTIDAITNDEPTRSPDNGDLSPQSNMASNFEFNTTVVDASTTLETANDNGRSEAGSLSPDIVALKTLKSDTVIDMIYDTVNELMTGPLSTNPFIDEIVTSSMPRSEHINADLHVENPDRIQSSPRLDESPFCNHWKSFVTEDGVTLPSEQDSSCSCLERRTGFEMVTSEKSEHGSFTNLKVEGKQVEHVLAIVSSKLSSTNTTLKETNEPADCPVFSSNDVTENITGKESTTEYPAMHYLQDERLKTGDVAREPEFHAGDMGSTVCEDRSTPEIPKPIQDDDELVMQSDPLSGISMEDCIHENSQTSDKSDSPPTFEKESYHYALSPLCNSPYCASEINHQEKDISNVLDESCLHLRAKIYWEKYQKSENDNRDTIESGEKNDAMLAGEQDEYCQSSIQEARLREDEEVLTKITQGGEGDEKLTEKTQEDMGDASLIEELLESGCNDEMKEEARIMEAVPVLTKTVDEARNETEPSLTVEARGCVCDVVLQEEAQTGECIPTLMEEAREEAYNLVFIKTSPDVGYDSLFIGETQVGKNNPELHNINNSTTCSQEIIVKDDPERLNIEATEGGVQSTKELTGDKDDQVMTENKQSNTTKHQHYVVSDTCDICDSFPWQQSVICESPPPIPERRHNRNLTKKKEKGPTVEPIHETSTILGTEATGNMSIDYPKKPVRRKGASKSNCDPSGQVNVNEQIYHDQDMHKKSPLAQPPCNSSEVSETGAYILDDDTYSSASTRSLVTEMNLNPDLTLIDDLTADGNTLPGDHEPLERSEKEDVGELLDSANAPRTVEEVETLTFQAEEIVLDEICDSEETPLIKCLESVKSTGSTESEVNAVTEADDDINSQDNISKDDVLPVTSMDQIINIEEITATQEFRSSNVKTCTAHPVHDFVDNNAIKSKSTQKVETQDTYEMNTDIKYPLPPKRLRKVSPQKLSPVVNDTTKTTDNPLETSYVESKTPSAPVPPIRKKKVFNSLPRRPSKTTPSATPRRPVRRSSSTASCTPARSQLMSRQEVIDSPRPCDQNVRLRDERTQVDSEKDEGTVKVASAPPIRRHGRTKSEGREVNERIYVNEQEYVEEVPKRGSLKRTASLRARMYNTLQHNILKSPLQKTESKIRCFSKIFTRKHKSYDIKHSEITFSERTKYRESSRYSTPKQTDSSLFKSCIGEVPHSPVNLRDNRTYSTDSQSTDEKRKSLNSKCCNEEGELYTPSLSESEPKTEDIEKDHAYSLRNTIDTLSYPYDSDVQSQYAHISDENSPDNQSRGVPTHTKPIEHENEGDVEVFAPEENQDASPSNLASWEPPSVPLQTWAERQGLPTLRLPSLSLRQDEEGSARTTLSESAHSSRYNDRDTPSPGPPVDSEKNPSRQKEQQKEDRTQKDRCVEVYPETVRQRQRNMMAAANKVDIKNWNSSGGSNNNNDTLSSPSKVKKFLPSVKALRNQFETGKPNGHSNNSTNSNTKPETNGNATTNGNGNVATNGNGNVATNINGSQGQSRKSSSSSVASSSASSTNSLHSPSASVENLVTSQSQENLKHDPDEPVEPIFNQFKKVDEELKELMSKPPSTYGWNPRSLLKRLYYIPEAPRLQSQGTTYVNIEGYLEKLPSGRKKATFWNAWKRRYFVAKDGILYYYQGNQTEKPSMKMSLMGGRVESMEPNMVGVDDGSRDTKASVMLGIDDGKGHYVVVRCGSRQEADRWRRALETHTVEDFASQYVQPWPIPTNPALLRDTLVIDIGSASIRAGVLASQATLPQVFMPSVVANSREGRRQVWGFDALSPEVRSVSSVAFPIRPSQKISKYSVDLSAVSSLLQKTFAELKVDPKNYHIQLSVPRVLNTNTQAELLRVLFDKHGVRSVNLTHQSILALYAYNATSGIVVDVGERMDIVPVIDGYIVDGGVSRVPYGGYRILDHLRQFLYMRNVSLINEVESFIIRHVLENVCYSANHYNTEKARCTTNSDAFEKSVSLSEYFSKDCPFESITLDFGRFQATEGLFNPDAWGLDHPGLHKLVHKAIMECSMDIRKEMSRSIFLAGGVTQMPGLVDRLTTEIDNLTPPAIRPKVHASPYRYHAAYIGACVLAESPAFVQSRVTREDFNKYGNAALRKWSL